MSPIYTGWVASGDLIDTVSITISYVRRLLLPAVRIENMRDVKQDMKNNE